MRWFWQRKKQKTENAAPQTSVSANDVVRVYDFDTQSVSVIPAAELAPGMIRATVNGIEGEVWVDGSQLQPNTYQHGPFDEATRADLRRIKATLDEVYPMSLEQWEDGFRRDRHPDREIAHWLHVADVYARLTAPDASPTLERKRDIFAILIGCGVSSREQVLQVSERGTLSRAEAEQVIAAFFNE